MWGIESGLISLYIVRAADHQCCCLAVLDLMRVVSLEEFDIPCSVEFQRCGENRLVVRGFAPSHTRYLAWKGDVDVVLRSEHDEIVSR